MTAGGVFRHGDSLSYAPALFALLISCSKFSCSIGPAAQCARRESNLQPSASEADATVHKPLDPVGNCDSPENVLARRWALLAQKDARLTALISAWPSLPDHVQAAIVTLCRLPGDTGGVP